MSFQDPACENLMKKFMEVHLKDSEVKRHGGEANSSSARLPEIHTPKHYPSTSAALEDFTPTPVGVQTASR